MALADDLREALLQYVLTPAGDPAPVDVTQTTPNTAHAVAGWTLTTSGWSLLIITGLPEPFLVRHDSIRALHAAADGDVLTNANSADYGGVRVGRTADFGALLGFPSAGQRAGTFQALQPRAVVTDSTLTGGGTAGSPLGVSREADLPPARTEVSSMAEVALQLKMMGDELPQHGPDYEYAESTLDTVRSIFARRLKPEALTWPEVSLAASMTVSRYYARRDAPLGVETADGIMRVMRDIDIADLLDGAWAMKF